MRKTLFCALVACAGFSHATVLIFDYTDINGTAVVDQAYGDNVTAATMGTHVYDISNGVTPDVTVSYRNLTDVEDDFTRWVNGYNDLTNVIEFEPDGALGWQIVFTASNNQLVSLHGFDVGNWGGVDDTVTGLSVVDGSNNVLWSVSDFFLNNTAGPHMSVDFGTALTASELRIIVDTSDMGAASDNVGLDNISFTQQPVPEPVTMALLGLGALAALKRRKKA